MGRQALIRKPPAQHAIIFMLAFVVAVVVGMLTHQRKVVVDYEEWSSHLIINSDTLIAVFLDDDGRVTAISPAAESFLGWEEAVGRDASDLLGADGGAVHDTAFKASEMESGHARIIRCRVPTDGGMKPIVLMVQKYAVGENEGYAAIIWPADHVDFGEPEQLTTTGASHE